jgi:NodT family efflux transporter outer membrane factor (OMF) lipoprotein
MHRTTRRAGLILGLAGVLAGCTVGPDFMPPEAHAPDAWTEAAAGPGVKAGPGSVTPQSEPDPLWWRSFNDPQLSELIDKAVAGNLAVQQAVLRVVAARAGEIQAAAAGLPSLTGTGNYTREQLGLKGPLQEHGAGNLANQFPELGPLLNQISQPFDLYQVGFDASWELDLFGRVRRSVEAAEAETEAALETRNDALVTLEAEVAKTYAQLRSAQAQTAAGHENLRAADDILSLTRTRRANGLAPQLDVESAVAERGTTESQLPQYERKATQAINSLSVLIGEPPGALRAKLEQASPPLLLPPDVPVGLPASLARRRPDIRLAEARLHAATAETGVAIAQLFPDVSLTGEVGLRADRAKYLTRWANLFYSFGPAVSLPIFEGGRLTANITLAKTEQAIAVVDYRKTVLNALEEVENALTAYRTDEAQRKSVGATVAAYERSLDLARDRYLHGLSSFIDVQNAEHNLDQNRQQLLTIALAETTDLISLYKALGGGWQQNAAQSGE